MSPRFNLGPLRFVCGTPPPRVKHFVYRIPREFMSSRKTTITSLRDIPSAFYRPSIIKKERTGSPKTSLRTSVSGWIFFRFSSIFFPLSGKSFRRRRPHGSSCTAQLFRRQASSCFSAERVRYLAIAKINVRIHRKARKMEKRDDLSCKKYLAGNTAKDTEDES